MFANPNTIWIEILVIAATAIFLAVVFGRYIYKKIHHLPTGECEYCHKGTKQLLEEYHKEYSKKSSQK